MSSKPAIGFCGLGAMGFGMATNLVKQGYSVTGFDVWQPSLDKFKAASGIPATTPAESAKDKLFYICMVANSMQAQDAIFDNENAIVKALPQGATFLLTSTVPSAYAKQVEKQFKDIGRGDVFFIDAPVSGGTFRAADGTLSIMAGASPEALEKGTWLLQEMSDPAKLFIVEGGIGGGSNLKMVHQVLAAIQILAVSEAFGFAARLGLDAKETREAIVSSEAWSWMFENRSVRTLAEDYYPGASAVTIIAKDTGIITSMSRLLSFPTPLTTAAEQVYFSGIAAGYGPNDDAGLVRLYFSDPVSSVKSTLSTEEKSAKLSLVIGLLEGVHLLATLESTCFAKHVGLPLQQFHELCVDAAGGSKQFNKFGQKIISILERGEEGDTENVSTYLGNLRKAVDEAQLLKVPLYLGSIALNLLLAAGVGRSGDELWRLVALWRVKC